MVASKPVPKYYLGENGEFVIEQYNYAKPFASFFPGIAGPHGIPMWAFYVNRGQCVCSMGIDNKEMPIMEFLFGTSGVSDYVEPGLPNVC